MCVFVNTHTCWAWEKEGARVGTRMFRPASASCPCLPAPHKNTSHFPPRCQSLRMQIKLKTFGYLFWIFHNFHHNLFSYKYICVFSSACICSHLWSGNGPWHDLFIHSRHPLAVVLCAIFKKAITFKNITIFHHQISRTFECSFSHHKQCQFVFGHRLQVRDDERFGEGVSPCEGFGRFDGGGEAVKPRPLTVGPGPRWGGGGRARLGWAVGQVRWDRRVTQQSVQLQTHCQRRQTLQVRTVHELLSAHHMRLKQTRYNENDMTSMSLFCIFTCTVFTKIIS